MIGMASLGDIVVDSAHPANLVPALTRGKSVKNRVHLDRRCADIALEARRLADLWACVIAVREELTVLADPEGNEFCLIR